MATTLPPASTLNLVMTSAIERAAADRKAEAERDYPKNVDSALADVVRALPAFPKTGAIALGRISSFSASTKITIEGNSCAAKTDVLNGVRAALTAQGYKALGGADFFEYRPLRETYAGIPATIGVTLAWAGGRTAVPSDDVGCKD